MSGTSAPTPNQILAAKLRMKTDRMLGRASTDAIKRIAAGMPASGAAKTAQ